MIKIVTKTGNLLNVESGWIIHSCNAQGIMGSGVALAVKKEYPEAFKIYRNEYETSGLNLGTSTVYFHSDRLAIVNAICQDNFGTGKRFTSYDAIATCFEDINLLIATERIDKEVHIPLIGAARGGGNWEIIREIIEQTMEFPVTLWLPDSTVTTL